MDTVIAIVLCLVIGYLCGNISTAYVVGKIYGIDIRKEGSGNLGSTNALRTLGIKAGIMTFVGDVAKALIPMMVVRMVIYNGQYELGILMAMWVGLGAVLGHNFPFWLHFKGGKGVAVTSTVVLATSHWQLILGGILIFVIIVAIAKYVSLGSLVVAFYLPANVMIWLRGPENAYFEQMLVVSFLFTILVIFQHRANIVRLLKGEEHKFFEKKKVEEE